MDLALLRVTVPGTVEHLCVFVICSSAVASRVREAKELVDYTPSQGAIHHWTFRLCEDEGRQPGERERERERQREG